ncbi:ImmA/IrrE family metallo-endopeptidase [Moraxella sp. ZJ142]|uniref:ImmA/IrrE family metallo-endopeptidase n=1 Tax=Moraxella marmotae TaxID=3344520 RepID=UPI0035D4EF2C
MGMTEVAVLPDKKLMHIREDVYEALHGNDPRARFTIAHEFGHLFMHKGVALNRGDGNHKTYEDSEWQANQFAAELLAPLKGCVGLSIDEIMTKYKISYQCAALRYKECKS